ncbi:hypothetical protein KCMC57_up00380 [Kitasatospora sp. CMC57]|uniref:KAP NTPase domain-containing protein n=1 Tax=Kitasatospora sp. CMC57 TaxID=3231513 RepID=A0AB33JQV5_9ACTN
MSQSESWIVEDVSIETHAADQFDHASVAREIADIVRVSRHSLAIGLLGGYGTGKSSVVRLLREELGSNQRWAVLHVSAERHSGVARGRGLLYGLIDEARRTGALTPAEQQGLRAGLEGAQQQVMKNVVKEDGKGGWKKYVFAVLQGIAWMVMLSLLAWLLGAAVVGVAHFAGGWPEVKAWVWFTAAGSAGPVGFLLSGAVAGALIVAAKEAAQNFLKGYDITLSTPRADTADELEQAFLRLIKRVNCRVVVAIDDIDRLAASDVLEALSTVRSLLLVGAHLDRPPVFLLSCDEAVVREAIIGVRPGLAHRPTGSALSGAAESKDGEHKTGAAKRRALEQAADEYLNKLFTVRISLPEHLGLDMREYAGKLLESHPIIRKVPGTALLDTVLDVLIHDGVRDPRHVIRLLNGFLAHYRLAERRESAPAGAAARIAKGEVTGYPLELARLTVLQYDFRGMFDDVQRERDLLHLLDDATAADGKLSDPDPLLAPYLVSARTEQADDSSLDYETHSALVYLRTVGPFTRPHRAPLLGPLLALGSEPDSRHLGGETARAIREELRSRNVPGFAARLQQPDGRLRVLQAAEITLTNARRGLALDNTLVTVVRGLGQQQAALSADEATRLADTAIRLRGALTTPLEAVDIAVLLALGSSSNHSALRAELRQAPESGDRRRAWAAVLLDLVHSPHGPDLAPVLDGYFETLAGDGDAEDLRHWTDSWQQEPERARETWPSSAYAFLLAGGATHGDDTSEIPMITQIVLDGADRHSWDRRIALGLLDMLQVPGQLRRAAVELLHHVVMPADGWGPVARPGQTLLASSTVAVHLVDGVATHLTEEQDDTVAAQTASLLRSWLPNWVNTANRTAIDLTVKAIVETADSSEELAQTTRQLLDMLPEQDAAGYAEALADKLNPQPPAIVPVASALRNTLIGFLHRADGSGSAMEAAAARVLDKLTEGIEADSATGVFARQGLPHVLSTPQGQAQASVLARRLIDAIPIQATQHAEPPRVRWGLDFV